MSPFSLLVLFMRQHLVHCVSISVTCFLLLAPGVLTVSLKLQVIVIVSCLSFSGALSEELYSSQFSCED